MSRLIINRLVYNIQTTDGEKYGAEIPFKKGLNIIYGPNSVGKTSIITGIIYGLGAEKGLGIFKSIQNPFKPEFYKAIDGKAVKTSYLLLEISNGDEVITIFRYIKGTDINIAAIKKCSTDNFFKSDEGEKLIISGEGVFSENGFQNFLFKFIGLTQVELPTYDQKLSKLYFENILPLLFVEQRAGWSQIQSRQVTRYNIKDVKKVAFEYLFGLDRFNLHLSEIKLKELEGKLKKFKDELNQKEENLLIIANAEKSDGILLVNTNHIGKSSIYDFIKYLRDKYSAESNFINQLSSQNKEFEESNDKLRDSLKTLDFQYRKATTKVDKITIEIAGYENYLDRIQTNKYKNKQLKKIKEFSTELNIKTCPVCEARLQKPNDEECLLCHSDLSKKISTPEQNLAFLEDEENTFKKVISQRILDRRKIIEQRNIIKDKIKEYESQLDHQTKTYAGKEFAQLRKRILEADSTHKEMEKYNRIASRWEDLDPIRKEIVKIDSEHKKLKDEISKYIQTDKDNLIINTIKSFIQSNVSSLGLFKGNKELINSIRIDENDNYTPYLDNFDIYNISSSSDNIRIILSYYLSLLQTSIKQKNLSGICYPNILILDEPKQQNLDNDSLVDCINVIENISADESQVILTTYSELISDREKFDKHIVYEMKGKTDYLLKKITK
ncbi:AAA family ATPase [Yeosuana marina]|uniref:AAA family ATPase n=1 Tax=Yeosuana marina TaxID=1565536 RepID=UPI0030EE056A